MIRYPFIEDKICTLSIRLNNAKTKIGNSLLKHQKKNNTFVTESHISVPEKKPAKVRMLE